MDGGAARGTSGYLIVGAIGRAHGIRGECWVRPLTDRPDAVYAAGRRLWVGTPEGAPAEAWGPVTVRRVRPFKGGFIVRFHEIRDRTVAESLRGHTLLIAREEAAPLEPGEVFVDELIGLEVRTVAGAHVGTVTDVYEVAATYLLGVRGPEGEQLVPMQRGFVKAVDLEHRILTLDPPPGWPV